MCCITGSLKKIVHTTWSNLRSKCWQLRIKWKQTPQKEYQNSVRVFPLGREWSHFCIFCTVQNSILQIDWHCQSVETGKQWGVWAQCCWLVKGLWFLSILHEGWFSGGRKAGQNSQKGSEEQKGQTAHLCLLLFFVKFDKIRKEQEWDVILVLPLRTETVITRTWMCEMMEAKGGGKNGLTRGRVRSNGGDV